MMREKEADTTVPNRFLAYEKKVSPVIFWNLTGLCNLSCIHCYNRSGPDKSSSEELSTAEALAFIDDCAAQKVPVILLSGGEPLMRDDIWELARHASRLGIKTALSSNGTLITREVAKKIHDAGIGYVGISLDGASAETHDRFRGADGAFERATQAFQNCKEEDVRCGVRMTVTKDNIAELEDLIKLSLRLSASRFCVYWLVPSGRGSDSYQDLQLDEQQVRDVLMILHRYAEETDPSVMEFLTVDGPQDAIMLLETMEKRGSQDLDEARTLISSMKGGCSAGIRVANVSPEGDVYPCQFAQTPEFLVGSIREKTFGELWNDPENRVLTLFRDKRERLIGRCTSCQYLDLCGGGCRIRAYHETGEFGNDDPFCFVKL